MAVDMGYAGQIRIGTSASATTFVHKINEWSLEMTADALEETAFGSTFDREYLSGLRSWSVTLSGYSEDSDSVQKYLIKNFTATAGPYSSTAVYVAMITGVGAGTAGTEVSGYDGKGIIVGVTRGATPDGLQTFNANIQGTGLLTTYAS